MNRKLVSFDWAIKKLLRSKANFGILEGFLSELLKTDITILQVLESESNQDYENDKYNRVDVKVKNSQGEIIIIEVQYSREYDFLQRICYGVSKDIVEYMQEGMAYSEVSKVISVSILYFNLGLGEDYIYKGETNFIGVHLHDQLQLNTKQQEKFRKQRVAEIFPEYYLIKVNKFDDVAKDSLDEWIYFLKHAEVKEEFHAKGLDEAKQKLDMMQLDDKQRAAYNAYQQDLHYQASMFDSSYGDGYGDGKKDGMEEGLEKGERQKALEIARNLMDVLDVETIMQKTGLSRIDIETLHKNP
ncbi:Rpn family recombination-promoting nuclease/putative transposase [Candidatus Albibeggiatoa sp. nov. NOAA]|uniref:Rpn family recombination-promoting nuclease/putative transposase n=1 Tax=Candidatus Albibeggiatoa sp. nov. NOAA TaxID=3162724 RepID=UPI0032FFC1C1|nr:Rpn family recombination-promoting nuclease/putative transposase [Thiotrichaceae bacterium]